MMAESQPRQIYTKMRIEKVRLVPEEAALGGCKTDNTLNDGAGIGSNCEADGCVSNISS